MSKLILHPEFKLYERKDKPLCTSLDGVVKVHTE